MNPLCGMCAPSRSQIHAPQNASCIAPSQVRSLQSREFHNSQMDGLIRLLRPPGLGTCCLLQSLSRIWAI